jgi:hypothetical protein
VKKTNLKKKVVLEAPHILRSMCNDLSPKKYQEFINFLDFFMMQEFNIKREQLPWLNPHCKHKDWKTFIGVMRLVVAKFFRNFDQQHFRHTKH